MDDSCSRWIPRLPQVICVLPFLLVSITSCRANEIEIAQAVMATNDAEVVAAGSVATAVAATIEAAPSSTPLPTPRPSPSPEPTPTPQACQEDMSQLKLHTIGTLKGGSFLVTFNNASPFQETEYILLLDGLEHTCTLLKDRVDRVYCVGPLIPDLPEDPSGRLAPVQLRSKDGTCAYELPFPSIPLPLSKPEPEKGGYD